MRVVIESPYRGNDDAETASNVDFARACLRDSLQRGEWPIASHLLYTQPGILDDKVPFERWMGIEAGLAWGELADATVVYRDRGISPGMQQGIDRAIARGRPVLMRWLTDAPKQKGAAEAAPSETPASAGR